MCSGRGKGGGGTNLKALKNAGWKILSPVVDLFRMKSRFIYKEASDKQVVGGEGEGLLSEGARGWQFTARFVDYALVLQCRSSNVSMVQRASI